MLNILIATTYYLCRDVVAIPGFPMLTLEKSDYITLRYKNILWASSRAHVRVLKMYLDVNENII